MAREEATKGLIIVSMYFVVLAVILFAIASISNVYGLSSDGFSTIGGNAFAQFEDGGFCSNPRFLQDTFFGNRYSGNDPRYKTLFDQGYILDEDMCDTLEGCVWTEQSSLLHTLTFGFFGSTSFVAKGTIDSTFYNNGVAYEESTTALQLWDKPVYALASLQQSETLCEQFGFTWNKEETFSQDSIGVTGIFRTFISVFRTLFEVTTLRFTFGNIPTLLNTLIVFVFIWSPLVYFFGCIYVLIR